jgi:hypothetical protein
MISGPLFRSSATYCKVKAPLYVVHPYRGADHLCVGAILPYMEARSATPLSDDEWKTRIDAGGISAPSVPAWSRAPFPDDWSGPHLLFRTISISAPATASTLPT